MQSWVSNQSQGPVNHSVLTLTLTSLIHISSLYLYLMSSLRGQKRPLRMILSIRTDDYFHLDSSFLMITRSAGGKDHCAHIQNPGRGGRATPASGRSKHRSRLKAKASVYPRWSDVTYHRMIICGAACFASSSDLTERDMIKWRCAQTSHAARLIFPSWWVTRVSACLTFRSSSLPHDRYLFWPAHRHTPPIPISSDFSFLFVEASVSHSHPHHVFVPKKKKTEGRKSICKREDC